MITEFPFPLHIEGTNLASFIKGYSLIIQPIFLKI